MSFAIGGYRPGQGPRFALEQFGREDAGGLRVNRRAALRLLVFVRPYWLQMLAAFGAMLVGAAMTLLAPYLVKTALDVHIAAGDAAGLARIALMAGAAYIGLYLANACQQYLMARVGQRALADLRHRLFQHLQALPLGYHDTHIVGVTVSCVINDVAVINDLLSQGLVIFVGDLLILAGIIVVMLSLSPRLALLAFIVVPLMLLATALFSRRARGAFRRTRSAVAAVVGDLAEEISGMRVIQAFAREGVAQQEFRRVNEANRDAHINAMSLSFAFLPSVEFLGLLATVIVLGLGGAMVAQGTVTLGVMVAFLSYVARFFQPIQELSQLYTTLQSAMAGGERVLELLDTPPGGHRSAWRGRHAADPRRDHPGGCHVQLSARCAGRAAPGLADHRGRPDRGAGWADWGRQDLYREPGRPLLRRDRRRGAHRCG